MYTSLINVIVYLNFWHTEQEPKNWCFFMCFTEQSQFTFTQSRCVGRFWNQWTKIVCLHESSVNHPPEDHLQHHTLKHAELFLTIINVHKTYLMSREKRRVWNLEINYVQSRNCHSRGQRVVDKLKLMLLPAGSASPVTVETTYKSKRHSNSIFGATQKTYAQRRVDVECVASRVPTLARTHCT